MYAVQYQLHLQLLSGFFELKSFISSENIFFATSESFSSASMFFAIVDFISLGKLEFTDSVNSLTEIGFIGFESSSKTFASLPVHVSSIIGGSWIAMLLINFSISTLVTELF